MTDNNYTPTSYQEDLDNDDNLVDPVMKEENEDIVDELGIPEEELGDELDKLDPDTDNDDARENVEDLDENADDDTKY